MGVQQLEDAAFARVVADLSDPLDLAGAVHGFSPIPFGRRSSLKDGVAECSDLPSQNEAE